jgi:hypothetical protein
VSQELKELIHRAGIKRVKACLEPSSGDFFYHEFDVTPGDFLEQAEKNYKAGGNAALLNAIRTPRER